MKFFWPYLTNKNPKIGKNEDTPLHFVAYHGLSDVADFMIEELHSNLFELHCKEDNRPIFQRGVKTPLYYASMNGHAKIIRSLRRKIDFELINLKWFKKSIYYALKKGHLDCVKALLEKQTPYFRKTLANENIEFLDIGIDRYLNEDENATLKRIITKL